MVGPASEAEAAGALTLVKALGLGAVASSERARPLSIDGVVTIPVARRVVDSRRQYWVLDTRRAVWVIRSRGFHE